MTSIMAQDQLYRARQLEKPYLSARFGPDGEVIIEGLDRTHPSYDTLSADAVRTLRAARPNLNGSSELADLEVKLTLK